MQQPLGLILAGGRGTRMGGADKANLRLGSKRLLDRCVERLEPQVAGVVVNANGPLDTPLPLLADDRAGYLGPLAGIAAGLAHAEAAGHHWIVSVAVDTPFFPCDLVPRLLLASEPGRPVLARAGTDVHGAFGLWPTSCAPALAAFLDRGARKLRQFAQEQGATFAPFEQTTPDAFFNINTPQDLEQATAWI